MNEEMAREELDIWVQPDNSLSGGSPYVSWKPSDKEDDGIALDGRDFLPEELEAIAWWMRNKNVQPTQTSTPATSDPSP